MIINTGYVTEAGYLVVTTFTLIIVNYPKHSFLHYICKKVFKLLYIGQRMQYLYIHDRPMLADNFSQLFYQSGLKCELQSILTITPSRALTNNNIMYGSDCEMDPVFCSYQIKAKQIKLNCKVGSIRMHYLVPVLHHPFGTC